MPGEFTGICVKHDRSTHDRNYVIENEQVYRCVPLQFRFPLLSHIQVYNTQNSSRSPASLDACKDIKGPKNFNLQTENCYDSYSNPPNEIHLPALQQDEIS